MKTKCLLLMSILFFGCPKQPSQEFDSLVLHGGYTMVKISEKCTECTNAANEMVSVHVRVDTLVLTGGTSGINGRAVLFGSAGADVNCGELLSGKVRVNTLGTLTGKFGACPDETAILNGIVEYAPDGNLQGWLTIVIRGSGANESRGSMFFRGGPVGQYDGFLQSKGKKCSP